MTVSTRPRRERPSRGSSADGDVAPRSEENKTPPSASKSGSDVTLPTTPAPRRSSRVLITKPLPLTADVAAATTNAPTKKRQSKKAVPVSARKNSNNKISNSYKIQGRKQKPQLGARTSNQRHKDQRRRKSKPLFLTNDHGDTVWIVTATLQDLRDRARQHQRKKNKNKSTSGSRRLELVNVPSKSVREAIYETAANSWSRHEARILPPYGDRPWRVTIKITDPKPMSSKGSSNGKTKASSSASSVPTPYFAWDEPSGELRIAAWPHLLDKIPKLPRFPGYSTSSRKPRTSKSKAKSKAKSSSSKTSEPPSGTVAAEETASATATSAEQVGSGPCPNDNDSHELVAVEEDDSESESEDEEESDEEVEDESDNLLDVEMTSLSRLAYQERWRVPLPSVSIKWISPLNKTFTTRASAWEHAVQLCKQEVAIDKTLHGYSSNGVPLQPTLPSVKASLTAGRYRFERDGLWVVGQEESWQPSRMQEQNDDDAAAPPLSSGGSRQMSPLAYYLQCNRKAHQAKRLAQLKEEQKTAAERAAASSAATATEAAVDPVDVDCEPKAENATDVLHDSSRNPVSFTLRDAERELRGLWQQLSDEEREDWRIKCKAHRDEGSIVPVRESAHPAAPGTPTSSGTSHSRPAAITPELPPIEDKPSAHLKYTSTSDPQVLTFPESTRWKLTSEQCKLCYDAGMEHLDRIMRTVQARDLVRELQDGFDLLRERGRGRYDMEIPDFDTPAFAFLSDLKKAPWMPIVREILGKDVVLIHKGMFLALPGAERQVYHQDGVHLTTQYQRDVHAINVFVPVVDMTAELGPTEFCLGSHLLGNEDFNEKFLESPIVKAGTPIIFDYRLGHRGLANQSHDSCRPIVYCTYARASDGKEFRDTVNFSRKRYHKIGDLVGKVATREERARKREELCHTSNVDTGPIPKRSCPDY